MNPITDVRVMISKSEFPTRAHDLVASATSRSKYPSRRHSRAFPRGPDGFEPHASRNASERRYSDAMGTLPPGTVQTLTRKSNLCFADFAVADLVGRWWCASDSSARQLFEPHRAGTWMEGSDTCGALRVCESVRPSLACTTPVSCRSLCGCVERRPAGWLASCNRTQWPAPAIEQLNLLLTMRREGARGRDAAAAHLAAPTAQVIQRRVTSVSGTATPRISAGPSCHSAPHGYTRGGDRHGAHVKDSTTCSS